MRNVTASLEREAGRHQPRLFRVLLSVSGVAVAAALSLSAHATAQETSGQDASQAAPEDRKAFFGEQHIHTSWSVDAWLFGDHTTGPDMP